MDWSDGPLSVKGQWSGWTESGVIGDATAATVEKGRAWLERAVEEICEYIDDMAGRRARPGQDHHTHAIAGNPREDDV
jgi:creatinine amidohydrolase/Fe(II)-dependent formamide hydrolase-like protein